MDLLLNNPLADMYGPLFLLVYALTIALVAVACRVVSRRLDWTTNMPPPPVPTNPDPHEIAYLRGGENEVTRSVVFALVQKGLLRVSQTGKGHQVGRTTESPNGRNLSPIERRALDWFTRSRKPSEMFKASGLAGQLKPFCEAYEQRLKGERLLVTDDARQAARLVALTGASVIVGLGAYKLIVAVAEGRFNVGFLIVLAVVGVVVLLLVSRAPRVSGRGRAYLERLRLAFDRLKYQAQTPPVVRTRDNEAVEPAHAFDPTLPLLVGVFGVAALAGTPFAEVERSFQRASAAGGGDTSGGSSCGSSCGSSSDSSSGGDSGGGSSCGSSCGGGGCGGGGCGG